MDNKIKNLKIIRKICIIPFVLLLIRAIYGSLDGVGGFFGEYTYGMDAFLLTIFAYFIVYWWLWALCIIIIITTSIIIKKNT